MAKRRYKAARPCKRSMKRRRPPDRVLVLLDRGAPVPRLDLRLDPYARHLMEWMHADLTRGPGGRYCCRWCGVEVKPPKRTFCSDACVHEWKLRKGGPYVRRQLHKRDRGVCAECGLDTKRIVALRIPDYQRLFEAFVQKRGYSRHVRRALVSRAHKDEWERVRLKIARISKRAKERLDPIWYQRSAGCLELWDADHVVPVVEGGGCCGLDNYQTLCVRCHARKTGSRNRVNG